MKHLKKFKQLNEGTLNEVYGKRKEWRYDEERFDADLKELLGAVNSVIEESPITFDLELEENKFTVTGPFNISMRVELDEEKNNKVGVKAYIDKTVIKAKDPKELWEKLKKSYEFKEFIKGGKIEKLREGRVNNIIKAGKGADELKKRELFLDYLYYVPAELITNKSDNSGPYATTGTSIRTYKYDLTPLSNAWDPKVEKPKFDNKEAEKIFKQALAEGGYYEGELTPEVRDALAKSAVVDIEELYLAPGQYAVYTFAPYMTWENLCDEMRTEITEKLGFKSRYLVDEKVSQFGVTQSGSNITLEIKVETTVWYN